MFIRGRSKHRSRGHLKMKVVLVVGSHRFYSGRAMPASPEEDNCACGRGVVQAVG